MKKLFRITTVPISLQKLVTGQLPYMRANGFEPLMLSADGPEAKVAIAEQESPHIIVPMTRKITPIQDLKSLWIFFKLCLKHKPEIIHSHTPKAGVIGMLGGKLAGVPVRLHTVAGLPLMEATGIKRRILTAVEKLTYASATRVYPNSTLLKDFILENNFCEPNKVKVIGNGSSNGIDTAFFCKGNICEDTTAKLKHELGIANNDFLFVFVGRIVKDKGIQELVNAFKALHYEYPNIKLLLVGPLEHDIDPLDIAILREIKENPAIIYAGYQDDVRPYLAISQVLVFPSYREGFPNVPMQAGCLDLPSIVTDINGCNEIVVDRKNGLIIPPKSVNALLEAMKKLLFDRRLFNHLKSNARPMIVGRYEQRHFWELLLKEYQEQLLLAK